MLTDDFTLLSGYRGDLWGGLIDHSFVTTRRPLAGAYFLVVYGFIGDQPATQAVVLGLLNVVLVLSIWRVGRCLVDPRIAYLTAAIMAVAPNRASTRLWFATGNYVLAMAAVVVAFGLLAVWRRPTGAAVLFCLSVLLFEGVAGLIAGLLLLWMWPQSGKQRRIAFLVGAPSAVAAIAMYLVSPKQASGAHGASESLASLGEGLFGSGLWSGPPLSLVSAAIFIGAIAAALITRLPALPSFRHDSDLLHHLRIGGVLTVAAALPFVAGRSSFAVNGIFDRSNLLPMLGTSLVAAALLAQVLKAAPVVSSIVLGACLLYATAMSVRDVNDYREASSLGRSIVTHLEYDLPTGAEFVIVQPPTGDIDGVAAFVYPRDIGEAITLRTSLGVEAILPRSASDCYVAAAEHSTALGYDWRTRTVAEVAADVCGTK